MNPICNLVGNYVLKMNYMDDSIVKEIDIVNLLIEKYFMMTKEEYNEFKNNNYIQDFLNHKFKGIVIYLYFFF